MVKFLLPILLALLGTAGGVAAGYFLKSPAAAHGDAQTETPVEDAHPHDDHEAEPDYFRIQQQFIVPIIHDGKMKSVVVTSLAIESTEAVRSAIIKREPKLRDALLGALFDHATIGGFEGNFVETGPMGLLKSSLLQVAREIVGPEVASVLILEIGKQDMR